MKLSLVAFTALSVLLMMPRAVAAQTPTEQQVASAVQIGERVRVTLADGKVWRGKLFLVKADALELSTGGRGQRVFALDQIRRIEVDLPDPVSDSAKRRAWIGLAIGGGFGAIIVLTLCEGFGDCAGGWATAGILAGVGTGIGAGIGAFFDRLVTDTRVVWPTTSASTRGPFGVGLVSGRRRLGLAMTIRW